MKLFNKHKYPIILIALFLFQFLFISPIGEFALNDDWVHTDTIQHWAETGEFRMLPFAGPTFYVPILYGAGLVKTFGFSFSLLRISTLVFMLATIVLFFLLLKKITKNNVMSFIGTLILWLNPMVYNLSFTFMTDIPALFLLMSAMYLYLKGFEEQKPIHLFWASLLCIAGMFTRQTNILLLAAAGLYSLTQLKHISFKNLLWSFGIPIIFGGLIYVWLGFNGLLPQNLNSHGIEGIGRLLGHIKWWLFYIPMYLGLFLFPITAGWIIKNKKQWKSKQLWILIGGFVLLALFIRQTYHLQLPYVINMISLFGLGPMHDVLEGVLTPIWSSKIWGLITILAAASAGVLIYLLTKKKINVNDTSFITIFGLLYAIPLLVVEGFDRYLIPLIVVMIILLFEKIQTTELSKIMTMLSIGVFAIFSISQTQFYMNWNQARWELANDLFNNQGIKAAQIDAGYEWLGWHDYWNAYESGEKQLSKSLSPWIRAVFGNNTREYMVSFSDIEGYDVITSKNLTGWNPNNTLFVLKKQENPTADR